MAAGDYSIIRTFRDGESMSYDPVLIAAYFDGFAIGEWNRLVRTPTEEVKLFVHEHYLRASVPKGSRVLEVGAGPGRFTRVLAELDCRVVVTDISRVQLDLNRRHAEEQGFARAVEEWLQVDMCDLGRFDDGSFDAVVAYGGPLSYTLDARARALRECRRVTANGGVFLLSVMSLWGGLHEHLLGALELSGELKRRIIATGDLTEETNPGTRHYCHLFTSDELRLLVEQHGFTVHRIAASNALSAMWHDRLAEIRASPEQWSDFLAMELEAVAHAGCVDMGTHLIAVARTTGVTGATVATTAT